MSPSAKKLLERIYETPECSGKISRKQLKPAQELINEGLAIVIRSSRGPGELALTRKGIDYYESNG